MIVTAARAAGLVALDGVCNVIEDGPVLAAECAQGAMFGFDGKSLIHPAQIAAANRAFGPTDEAVAWAARIIAAFALPGECRQGRDPRRGRDGRAAAPRTGAADACAAMARTRRRSCSAASR